jgi:putative ubiquitin-RnfH superfamily antitoxin RatB of RatAB toxin-antitoxin module
MTDTVRVTVVYALPDAYWSHEVVLPAPATVAQALAAAKLEVPGLVVDPARLAVFGQATTPGTTLHDGDRVEILRPLLIDPKDARRKRAEDAKRR